MHRLSPGFALVTGASGGIGAAFARALPPDRPLLLTALDEAGLEALRRELAVEGRPVRILPADLTVEAGRQAVIAAARALPLALLINNAGFGSYGPFLTSDPARQAAMVQLNCLAPVVLTQALLPALLDNARRQGGHGGLILVASVAALVPLPRFATYSASKAFDLVLGECLADELRGQPLDVVTLCPPPTRTAFNASAGIPGGAGGMDPGAVAAAGLRALGRRSRVVPGREGRRFALLHAFVPRRLLRPLVRRGVRRALPDPAPPGDAA